ncbi:MAG: hypothetical protein FJX60_18385 [Alphaproteobacteria bacterium]|nr:hypothetical protein [Alphaproteobacteria bacterium]
MSRTMVSKDLPVDPRLVGEYRDSSDLLGRPADLRRRLAEDGYLLLRGALDRDVIAAARREVFARLAEVGEIRFRGRAEQTYALTLHR